MKKLILFFALLALACSGDNDPNDAHNCTEEARAGLNITVKDAVTNEFLGEGITVVATDGQYTETLEYMGYPDMQANFAGAWERPGTYVLTVSGAGYQTYTSEPVIVGSDVCHVIQEMVTVALQPE